MTQVLFVFATLVALAYSQCQLAGNTYALVQDDQSTLSLTFGAPVEGWLPSIHILGDVDNVVFGVWNQETETRWSALTVASDSPSCNNRLGQYNLEWATDCSSVTFAALDDQCLNLRHEFLNGLTYDLVEKAINSDCLSVGTVLNTRLGESPESLRLSGEPTTIVFGPEQFSILSAGTQAAHFQRWRANEDGTIAVVALESFPPETLPCGSSQIATYELLDVDAATCSMRMCGKRDLCTVRAELFHGLNFNGYDNPEPCLNEVEGPVPVETECNDNTRQWNKHPWDCTDKPVEGKCFYCKGIARGEFVSLCLNRDGAGCNQIFESATSRTFCNLEFECPASMPMLSLFVFIFAALVALLTQ